MTKPGFVDKRIEYFIHEELKKFDSLMQRNAFLEGVKFMRENINAFIEQPTPTVENKETSHLDDIKNIEKIAEVFYYQLMDEFAGAGMNYKDLAQRKKGFVEGYLVAKEDKQ